MKLKEQLSRPELGTIKRYVPGKPIEEVIKEYGLREVVKLASNENPLGPSAKAIEAIQREAGNVHIYPDGQSVELRAKLSSKLGVSPEQILLSNGGEEIIKMLAYAFIEKDDEVIFAVPSFDMYEIATNLMGGVPVKVPLTSNFEHNMEGFIERICSKTKMIFLCNPNNPTGNIIPEDQLKYLTANIPDDILLVLDEAYYEYASVNPQYPDGIDLLEKRPNTILIRTLSKVSGLAGLRVGYMISSKEIIEETQKVKNVFNVNRLAQTAALAALEDGDHVDRTIKLNYVSLTKMINFFKERKLYYVPSNANFIWVNVGLDTRKVYEELLKEGVIIRPGFLWGCDEYIRVSTGTIEQTEVFIRKLEKVLENANGI